MLLINPGSHLPENKTGQGWTNTHAKALERALGWLKNLKAEGMTDIIMWDTKEETDGRWKFIFHHKITKVDVELETHGIDDLDAYQKEHIFAPRVYWNGSSTGEPELEQWAKEGFRPVKTYKEKEQEC